jgi:heterodisulfide reductase subunit A-like polyferredoxin
MNKKIVIIGAGVAGINAATTLIDNGYSGGLITIIDKDVQPKSR